MGVFADELRAGIDEAARKLIEARLAGDDYGAAAYASGSGSCAVSRTGTGSGPGRARSPPRGRRGRCWYAAAVMYQQLLAEVRPGQVR